MGTRNAGRCSRSGAASASKQAGSVSRYTVVKRYPSGFHVIRDTSAAFSSYPEELLLPELLEELLPELPEDELDELPAAGDLLEGAIDEALCN